MGIKDIDPVTLRNWIDAGEAVLVDVREPHENAQERIAGAHLLPLSKFHPERLPEHDGRIVVYHCATGTRTGVYGGPLTAATPAAREVYHLAGGISAWKQAGLPTEGDAPAPARGLSALFRF
jgi:rhodanese-related sulfurtransferase